MMCRYGGVAVAAEQIILQRVCIAQKYERKCVR